MSKGFEVTIPPPLIALTVAMLMWGIAQLVPGAARPCHYRVQRRWRLW